LIRDGRIVAAVQEDRFTRKKHDASFPIHSIQWCLKENGIKAEDLNFIVFYEKPWIKFERILETCLSYAPSGISQYIQALPLWLKHKLWIPEIIRQKLNYKGKILFCEHHEAHTASAFYPSPFLHAAFLTIDGVGEWETATFGVGNGKDLNIQAYLAFPHSLGLLYSTFTYYTGFKVNSGEYKLMGLAPYGNPVFADLILDNLIDLKDDGSFKLNMRFFGYCNSLRMTNTRFEKLFKSPAREPETPLRQQDMDIAASIQKVTEEIMLRMARHVHKVTGEDSLCLAGGVALNCVGNGKLLREGPFKNIWIQPASGDAGGALGAALLIWHRYLGNERSRDGLQDIQQASLLGPEYCDEAIEQFLVRQHATFAKLSYPEITEKVADLVVGGNVVGWFQGKVEFGPRALGARSIIADPRRPDMQSKMNLKIKFRESFRPFAPTVLREHVNEWFEFDADSPYMLLVAPVRQDKRQAHENNTSILEGLDKLKSVRSCIPAVTHVDYSARIQTVTRKDNPLYYDVINAFYRKTGCPLIINTSFNVRGEPIVCTPEDAWRCFMRTEMDHLVMGNFLLDKKEQNIFERDVNWQKEFVLD
jgi:carbamoyltransferase